LRHLYYDVAEIVSPAPLKALTATADSSHILFGSDFPFSRHRSPAQDALDMIAAFDAFGDWDAATRRAIEYGNAARLFPRLAAAIERVRA
jgi:predicted TIM-barrel fold metal-dependent hydrolase